MAPRSLRIAGFRLVARLLAIALTAGLLYGLVCLERLVFWLLPTEAARWYHDHDGVQAAVDIPLALAALLGALWLLGRAFDRIAALSGNPAVKGAIVRGRDGLG